jgi:hypothetical protein
MKARFIHFGEVEINGQRYTKDIVVTGGEISKRDKGPSKAFRAQVGGHTPLSAGEAIPWDCERLIIGTGAHGQLPVMDEVHAQAREQGVELLLVPTEEACERLSEADVTTTNAILHLTC